MCLYALVTRYACCCVLVCCLLRAVLRFSIMSDVVRRCLFAILCVSIRVNVYAIVVIVCRVRVSGVFEIFFLELFVDVVLWLNACH